MSDDRKPPRSARSRTPPRAEDPLEEFKRNQALFERYLEQILLDPKSPVWERLLDGLASHSSERVAGVVAKGIRLDDDVRAELARRLLSALVEALGLEPELTARLSGLLNRALISRPEAEKAFKRVAGRLVVDDPQGSG